MTQFSIGLRTFSLFLDDLRWITQSKAKGIGWLVSVLVQEDVAMVKVVGYLFIRAAEVRQVIDSSWDRKRQVATRFNIPEQDGKKSISMVVAIFLWNRKHKVGNFSTG